MKTAGTIASSLGLLAALLLTAVPADAGRVERIFRGKVVVLKKRPPFKFRSQGHFVSFLRKNRLKRVWPVKKGAKRWKIRYMAFFKRSHRDRQVKVRFYDITEGRQFVAGDSVFLSSKGQKVLSSSFVLEKPRFRVNRKYLMYVLTSRNVVLARTTFRLRGRVERYSGRVTFSDEETR